MRISILAIGKPKLPYAKAGVEEYAKRLTPWGETRIDYLKSGSQEEEGAQLLARSEGMFRVILDERGDQVSSRGLADKVAAWEQGRIKAVAFLIGGADGHSEAVRSKADWRWALGKITLQHELALVVLLEQIYRARTILAGSPYHRD